MSHFILLVVFAFVSVFGLNSTDYEYAEEEDYNDIAVSNSTVLEAGSTDNSTSSTDIPIILPQPFPSNSTPANSSSIPPAFGVPFVIHNKYLTDIPLRPCPPGWHRFNKKCRRKIRACPENETVVDGQCKPVIA